MGVFRRCRRSQSLRNHSSVLCWPQRRFPRTVAAAQAPAGELGADLTGWGTLAVPPPRKSWIYSRCMPEKTPWFPFPRGLAPDALLHTARLTLEPIQAAHAPEMFGLWQPGDLRRRFLSNSDPLARTVAVGSASFGGSMPCPSCPRPLFGIFTEFGPACAVPVGGRHVSL